MGLDADVSVIPKIYLEYNVQNLCVCVCVCEHTGRSAIKAGNEHAVLQRC
jgi:hypothetical protein